MSILAGALRAGRRQAGARFTESLNFYVDNGVTTNPDTLVDTRTTTVLYTVPGRVKYPTSTVSESAAAGQSFATQDVQVHVAVGSTPNVRPDHFCRVVASTVDPGLVGRVYRIKGSAQAGQVTASRYPVEEAS